MEVARIDEGLWRWTAPHPDWTPEQGGDDGWQPEVGCVFVEAGPEIVLIDPLVPAEPAERDRFWRALDRDVERVGSPPVVLISVHYHGRSAREMLERYAGASVLAPAEKRSETERQTPVTASFSAGDPLPGGIEALSTAIAREVVFWLPSHRTLVTADIVLGTRGGGLRLCPEGWLEEGVTRTDLAASLRPLLELPIERVLPSLGEPVLASGRDALAAALGGSESGSPLRANPG